MLDKRLSLRSLSFGSHKKSCLFLDQIKCSNLAVFCLFIICKAKLKQLCMIQQNGFCIKVQQLHWLQVTLPHFVFIEAMGVNACASLNCFLNHFAHIFLLKSRVDIAHCQSHGSVNDLGFSVGITVQSQNGISLLNCVRALFMLLFQPLLFGRTATVSKAQLWHTNQH